MQMTRYQTSTPRASFVIAALTLTALTFGVSIIAPSKMDAASHSGDALASKAVAPAPIEIVDVSRIDVIGVRDAAFVPAHAHRIQANDKQRT
jgi:hypothetical protein